MGLIALAYVGGYVAARHSGHLWRFEFAFHASPAGIGDPLDEAETFVVSSGDDRVAALFLPCIAAEEWWLNR